LLIRRIDLHETVDLFQLKKRPMNVKSLLLQRSRLKHPLFKSPTFYPPTLPTDQAEFTDSKTRFYEYRSSTIGHEPRSPSPVSAKIYNNNYKSFPKRGLLVRPHVVKNTNIPLNLFNRQMEQSAYRCELLAKTLHVQMGSQRRTSSSVSQRRGSQTKTEFNLERKLSVRLAPWDHPDDALEPERF
jgi:hypothetical protein